METKELIKFLKTDVMDWDGWGDAEQEVFLTIIKRLRENDKLNIVAKEISSKCKWIIANIEGLYD